jgi:hypothetical protein
MSAEEMQVFSHDISSKNKYILLIVTSVILLELD